MTDPAIQYRYDELEQAIDQLLKDFRAGAGFSHTAPDVLLVPIIAEFVRTREATARRRERLQSPGTMPKTAAVEAELLKDTNQALRALLRDLVGLMMPKRPPTIEEILAYRERDHPWVQLPPNIETDRTDLPCFLCLKPQQDSIHAI